MPKMRYCYLITTEVWNDLDRKEIDSNVPKKLRSLEESQSRHSSFSDITDVLSKSDGPNATRFIWFRKIQQDVCMYILRKVYSHEEYGKEINNGTKNVWPSNHPLSFKEQSEMEEKFKILFRPDNKAHLPQEFRKYEGNRVFEKGHDTIFYELPLWCEGMRKLSLDYWESIRKEIEEIKEFKSKSTSNSRCVFRYIKIGKITITYRSGNEQGNNDVYLLQIAEGNEPNWTELQDKEYDCDDVTDLKSLSSKCYPDYFTYDQDEWRDIEEDDLANLTLSEEEVDILQNVKFPFFISGLAGSGKSLILCYLFANVFKYQSGCPGHQLLFLSYNDMLVDKARRRVKAILKLNRSNQNFDNKYFDDPRKSKFFDDSFVPFRSFLIANFLNDESVRLFSEEKRLTYEKFRKLYQEKYRNKDRLSPSILWSVIRTFIKGGSLAYMTPEDYRKSENVFRDDRTVSQEDFDRAYKIWNTWYRHYYERKEYWDDLDLVRYVHENGDTHNVFHKYAVIFCDEAQDFTRLEIDLILKLSKHSYYSLANHPDDRKIPIAFAGDPNQTISPTGFRWAGTKRLFSDAFRNSLDSYLDLDEKELTKNYRSQLGIVKFANTIQCIRYEYFDDKSRGGKLQSVRENPKGDASDTWGYVGFYSYDQNKSIILDNLHNANIITSGDGEEGDRKLFPEIKDKENKKIKLNTAIGTKGLEYDSVMLLNFYNDKACGIFQKILSGTPIDESEKFEISHFFTKLYIAVSRARKYLFIVDTDESYDSFWKYFTDVKLWKNLIGRFGLSDETRKLVGHITPGDIKTLPDRLNKTYNPEENGRQTFERAKAERSASLMRKAAIYYDEVPLRAKVKECEAYALWYEFNYLQSGDKFIAIDKVPIALDVYWKGRCWEKVISAFSLCIPEDTSSYNYNEIRKNVSGFMSGTKSGRILIDNLVSSIDGFIDAYNDYPEDQIIWEEVFDNLKEKLLSADPSTISSGLIEKLNKIARYVRYDEGLSRLRASLYYRKAAFDNEGKNPNDRNFIKDDYLNAIDVWEKAQKTDNKEYYTAKKLTAKSPSEKIRFMDRLNENREIVESYGGLKGKDENGGELTDEAQGIVFSSLLRIDYLRAAAYPYLKDNEEAKNDRLYGYAKNKFIILLMLKDFTLPEKDHKKYKKYIEGRIERGDNVFDGQINREVYDAIFSLNKNYNKKPVWQYFMSDLKAPDKSRVFKKIDDRTNLLDSLSEAVKADLPNLKDSPQGTLMSYFLEFLFDGKVDSRTLDRYKDTIVTIFSTIGTIFNRGQLDKFYYSGHRGQPGEFDFRGSQYFEIRDHIRKYANGYIVNAANSGVVAGDDVKTMLRTGEICCAITEEGKYDYNSICEWYNQLLRNGSFVDISRWMKGRLLLNEFVIKSSDNEMTFSQFKQKLEENEILFEEFVDDLSKDDAYMFVASINSGRASSDYEAESLSENLINKFNLEKGICELYCTNNDSLTTFSNTLNKVFDSRRNQQDNGVSLTTKGHPQSDMGGATAKGPSAPQRQEIASPPISKEKQAQLDMAKVLMNQGIPADTILKAAHLLNQDDLDRLQHLQ